MYFSENLQIFHVIRKMILVLGVISLRELPEFADLSLIRENILNLEDNFVKRASHQPARRKKGGICHSNKYL